MLKSISIFCLILLSSLCSQSQTADKITLDFLSALRQKQYDVCFSTFDSSTYKTFSAQDLEDSWSRILAKYGELDSFSCSCVEQTVRKIYAFPRLYFAGDSLNMKFAYTKNLKLTGFFLASGHDCNSIHYAPPPYDLESKYTQTIVSFPSDTLVLDGTLTVPVKLAENAPVVVFVHGSGPADRDETSGPNKIFRDLAVGLALSGIPSLRYDKRSFEHRLPINCTVQDEVIIDVHSAVRFLNSMKEFRHKDVIVVGHSLGAMLAPEIARTDKNIQGIVLMAGNARPLPELLKEQYAYLSGIDGVVSPEEFDAINSLDSQVKYLKDSLTFDSPKSKLPLNLSGAYWLSLNEIHQVEIAKSLTIPILVLQGERDYQVLMKDFLLWKTTLGPQGNATFRSYPKLNHLFFEGTEKSVPEEYMEPSNVPWYVINDMTKWMLKK